MADTSDPVEDVASNLSKNDSSPADDLPENAAKEYHRTEFWKALTIGVVTPADAETVLAATKDLCRHFLSQEDGPLFMEKAAKLAAQYRNLDEGRLSELMVDHAGLQQLFTLDPSERLDISLMMPKENEDFTSDVNVSTSFSYQTLVDPEAPDARSGFWSRLSPKKSIPTKPITISTGNSADSALRLSFSNTFRYKKQDQAWLEAFLSSVDNLTETQALIFGPAFACFFVVLEKSSHVPVHAKILYKLPALLVKYASPKVAQIVAGLKVQMPPAQQLTILLSVYAKEKPSQVHFNTVVGGFMYANHRQNLSISSKSLIFSVQLLTVLTYHGFRTPLKMFLNRFDELAKKLGHPRVAELYYTFVEQNFPESWKAFCKVRSEYMQVQPGAAEFDPFWNYARAFSDTVFEELSYRRHHRVCNISSVVLDLLKHPSKVQNWPFMGPTYRSYFFLESMPPSMAISGCDAIWAVDMYKVLKVEMRNSSVDRGWHWTWTCCLRRSSQRVTPVTTLTTEVLTLIK